MLQKALREKAGERVAPASNGVAGAGAAGVGGVRKEGSGVNVA